jgi:glucuronoarabinoxylan endo-1,4-beta-xylanase
MIVKGKYYTSLSPIIILSLISTLNAATVAIDATKTHQTIDGFGACSAWISSKITSSLAIQFWQDDTINGHIGLSLLRTRIDPSGYTSDEAAPMTKAIQVNPKIMLWSTSWTPPKQYKDNNSLVAGNLKSDSASMQGFANHLVKYVQDVKKNNSIDLYAVSCQNEPDADVTWDGCYWTGEQFRVFVRDYWGPACKKAGITAKRMISESVKNDLAISDPSLKDTNAAKYVDIIGDHLYDGGPYPYPLADSLHKPYWETEIGGMKGIDTSIGNAIMWANQIHDCLVRCNMNAYHFWWLVNNNTNDDEGLCNSNGLPTPRMFALGNFSKFIRPGFVRIGATDSPASGIAVSAYYGRTDSRLVIVAINSGAEIKLDFTISGIPEGKTAVPWLTDNSHRLERQTPVPLSNKAFYYTMPSKSIATFVMRDVVATAVASNNKTPYSLMKLTRQAGNWRLEVPSSEKPRALQILTPSGRELRRISVPQGSTHVVFESPNFAGVMLARALGNTLIRNSLFVQP